MGSGGKKGALVGLEGDEGGNCGAEGEKGRLGGGDGEKGAFGVGGLQKGAFMGSGGTIGSGGGWGWGALTARKVVLHQSAVALIVAFPLIGFPFGGAGKGGGAVLGFWGLGGGQKKP